MNNKSTCSCSECNAVFKRLYDLRKHVKKFHEGKLDELAPLKNRANAASKTYNFSCDICKKNFTHTKHLTFHKKIHGVSGNSATSGAKKCPLCSFTDTLKINLYSHFKESHGIEMCYENFDFTTKKDFEVWKNAIERNSKLKFIKECGDIKCKSHRNLYYICHRSGCYASESQNKRHLKTQGSRKIGGFCPSGIKVMVDLNDQHRVTYLKTHVGHTMDLCHLNLTIVEKQQIASKIAQKIPFSDILDEVRDGVTEDSIQRIHLLTKKDLNNIATAFNLQSEAVRHPNDAISIEAWVNDLRHSNCVLFYKCQDSTLDEYPELKSEDFLLIIMNESQSQILEKFSSDCVCIDGTYGLNAYNFELHTLLVLDELRQGFPTAFLISNRSDEQVMSLFFSCIKEKIGFAISPKVFMSDMADSYYNAWRKVMNEAEFRLYCTWHVDRAWRKNLNSVNTNEKRVEIYKCIRTLLQGTDQTAFITMFGEFLKSSSEDPDTANFSTYFKENYGKNVKSWAYSYRLHSGLNTNMHLERMHKTLKYIYLGGKHVKRLDKSVACIMRFVKDKLFDRIITLNKGKICSKLRDLRKRHHKSMEIDVNMMNEVNDGWQVLSSSSKAPEIYQIQKNDVEHSECELTCSDCKICIHKYSCSCLDSSIRWNMCKHIHLLGRKILNQEAIMSTADEASEDENEKLHIHVDSRNAEAKDIYKRLSTTGSNDLRKGKSLEQKKEEMRRWFDSVLESVESDSQFHILAKLVAPIEPTLQAAVVKDRDFHKVLKQKVPIPHNKKIDQQRRLFSTKKKNNKSNKLKKPSTEERNKMAASLLSLART